MSKKINAKPQSAQSPADRRDHADKLCFAGFAHARLPLDEYDGAAPGYFTFFAVGKCLPVHLQSSFSEPRHLAGPTVPVPARANDRTPKPLTDISVLVVDDDLGTRETFDWALRSSGIRVRTSASGADAIRLAKANSFDLLLVDLELRDMRGTDVIRAVRAETGYVPFVLISAFLTTDVTVEAMRLGALDVVDKPVSVDELPLLVRAAVACCGNAQHSLHVRAGSFSLANLRRFVKTVRGGSAAERWALNVIKGCLVSDDPRTLKQWAKGAGVSYTVLRESCTLVGIQPHDARDLMRMLRAVLHSAAHGSALDVVFDTGDTRTLAHLIETAGFHSAADVQSVSIEEFFSRQGFVVSDSQAVLLLRNLVLRHTR